MAVLKKARIIVLWAITALVVGSTAASLTESYRGLVDWAMNHDVAGNWAYFWPAMIDTFTVVGELVLFIALIEQWDKRGRVLPWVLISAGLAVSVASNVGHIGATATIQDRLTAGVPPIAAWAALAAALAIVKRVALEGHAQVQEEEVPAEDTDLEDVPAEDKFSLATQVFADDIRKGRLPGLNRIRAMMHVGHDKAPKIQAHLGTIIAELEGAK